MAATIKDSEMSLQEKIQVVKKFQESCLKHSQNTENVRTDPEPWPNSTFFVPDIIKDKIGSIVSLIQEKINQGYFCDKAKEVVVISSVQNQHLKSPDPKCQFYVLEMYKIPKDKMMDFRSFKKPLNSFQLFVDESGNVVNESYFLDEMGYLDDEEVAKSPLEHYGDYHQYADPLQIDFVERLRALQASKLLNVDPDLSSLSSDRKIVKELVKRPGIVSKTSPVPCASALTYKFIISPANVKHFDFLCPPSPSTPPSPLSSVMVAGPPDQRVYSVLTCPA